MYLCMEKPLLRAQNILPAPVQLQQPGGAKIQ